MDIKTKNIGTVDRAIRSIAGVLLIAFAMSGDTTGYEWLGWIGIIPLATAFFGICPMYSLVGIKTSAT